MIISLNWLKKYADIGVPTDELVELIGSRLVEVEEVIDLAPRYKDCVIVKVEQCDKVEGSDHLSLCQVNAGSGDLVQVVCGANNVYAGMLAVWLPPKSVVPETYGTGDEFVLESRKLMGQVSNGMLASMRELGLGDDHDGIVEIDPESAKPGDSFAEKFALNDTLLDIENKSLTHRPDCFGNVGFAREVAGILGSKFNEPPYFAELSKFSHDDQEKIEIEIADAELCPRYQAVIMELPESYPRYLTPIAVDVARVGMRAIDPVVDSANLLMLLTGQPLHTFDYDKFVKVGGLGAAKVIVRAAKEGEKLELLDGKTIELDSKDIVITSNDVPVALAGAMGGANTAIDKSTKRILVESATFNLYSMRGTQFRHGIFSEAITRFTKGQPPALTNFVICKFAEMTSKIFGLKAVSKVFDAYPVEIVNQPIQLTVDDVNKLLGSGFDIKQVRATLENVGFAVHGEFKVTAPWWRTDIHIEEDVIEEVGRLTGFDNILAKLPMRSFEMPTPDDLGDMKAKIRRVLSDMSANEVLTYSFVGERLLKKVGQDPANSYKIINSTSPELQYVRQQLAPSLLEKVYKNTKAGYSGIALFEMNQVFVKNEGMNGENVPIQHDNLALAVQGDFYLAKLFLNNLTDKFGIKLDYRNTELGTTETFYEPKHSAGVFVDDLQVGIVGGVAAGVKNNFKLAVDTSAFEIELGLLLGKVKVGAGYKNQSGFQGVERDMTFKVAVDMAFAKLETTVKKTLQADGLQSEIAPLDIYQGDDSATKNITFRIKFASYDKTLNGQEIAGIVNKVASAARKELNAEII
ncbi:MAG: phenylalanine--tRNA ligase subunit beta [Candidatus Nomurabacteria bacterium]|jgi:phenylalanyl-tRNA synthetase beta chain|nr:phenylalanine--tRNA ligase subunit beta [Candidatus Nomurabacteria bacterium]